MFTFRAPKRQFVLRVAPVAALLAGAAVAIWWWTARGHGHPAGGSDGLSPSSASGTDGPQIVTLNSAKLQAAALHVSPVEAHELQETRRVPGKIGYNTAHRLELKVPASGVVKHIAANPGQRIRRGDELAQLTSVEVGFARDEVNKCDADRQLAQQESQWAARVADNLETLLAMLDARPEVADIEQRFQDKVLGDHRDKVVSAYSKFLLADRVSRDTEAMASKGAIAERLVLERASGREVSAAYFKGVCEQSRFDAKQQRSKTQAALEHAERVLAVSQQRLKLLVGPFAEIASAADNGGICELVLRAPLDGIVEDRFVADGAQFVASQTLFAVANTDTLWVSAQIYEREWAALAAGDVKELVVQSPALPDRDIAARVQFIGASMSPETRAVPLVAELANLDNRLKPGMFVWVSVPLGPKRRVPAVPTSALMRHEGLAFVFVEESPGRYRRADVTPGLATPELTEITKGVSVGDRVVDSGAFFLKSELLLEGEE